MLRFTKTLAAFSVSALLFTAAPFTHAAPVVDPDFPKTVALSQGAANFQNGDEIVLTKTLSATTDFKPGNTYKIQGDYRLLSHPSATLAVSITAPNGNAPAPGGRQTMNITKGIGHFTLVLPYASEGRARITFNDGGDEFGSLTLVPGSFPYIVSFTQSNYDMPLSDDITVSEIRVNTPTVGPGTLVQVKGNYTLANGIARLSTSNSNPADSIAAGQSVEINQGVGDFTLLMPITNRGVVGIGMWAVGNGNQPIGSVAAHLGAPTPAPAAVQKIADIPIVMASDQSPVLFNYSLVRGDGNSWNISADTGVIPGNFPFAVPFKNGLTEYTGGDMITISSVRGTAKNIRLGGLYQITGTYNLSGFSEADLAAHITTPDWCPIREMPQQHMIVEHGRGRFTLLLAVPHIGWPHLAFYPDNWLTDSDTHYFGTGDSVLHSWDDLKPPTDESSSSGAAN